MRLSNSNLDNQYQPRKVKLTPAERRKLFENVGHLLNKLRSCADECDCPLTGAEEETFWTFIHTLPADDQSSIIN
jgi:hypothetical protein